MIRLHFDAIEPFHGRLGSRPFDSTSESTASLSTPARSLLLVYPHSLHLLGKEIKAFKVYQREHARLAASVWLNCLSLLEAKDD